MASTSTDDLLAAQARPAWRGLLAYVQRLRRRSIRPPLAPLPHAWEEIGPGYCYGPAFGHWDIVHQVVDGAEDDPAHAARQVRNLLAIQQEDGLIPGSLWQRDGGALRFSRTVGHPPVWPAAVDACLAVRPDDGLLADAWRAAERQLDWFCAARRAPDGGFYYTDITARTWESGIDEGVRFDDAPSQPAACIDATCHVAFLAQRAAAWAARLGTPSPRAEGLAAALGALVRERLWCDATGFFHDAWAVTDPARRRLVHEGFWPLALGLASPAQAQRLIDDHLLNPAEFLTLHPLPSVALSDPGFSLRMWRGPSWNSITWWVARGCLAYGRADAARLLLARALDASAAAFVRTRCIWEFYHPLGGDPLACQRKPDTTYDQPCRDYLGHNPLRAMARLHRAAGG